MSERWAQLRGLVFWQYEDRQSGHVTYRAQCDDGFSREFGVEYTVSEWDISNAADTLNMLHDIADRMCARLAHDVLRSRNNRFMGDSMSTPLTHTTSSFTWSKVDDTPTVAVRRGITLDH
jgi:hypothetical protein